MNSLDQVKSFLKRSQLEDVAALEHAQKVQDNQQTAILMRRLRDRTAAMKFIDTLPEPPPQEEGLFSLNPLDLRGLPAEFVADLKAGRDNEPETQILELMEIARRPVSIDELKVALYRKFNVEHKRNSLASRLYRMVQAGLVRSTEKRKGYYEIARKQEPPEGGS